MPRFFAIPAAGAGSSPTTLPPLLEAIASFGAAIRDGRLYVYGGHIGQAHLHWIVRVCTAACLSAALVAARADDGRPWPAFLGPPAGDSKAAELPIHWSAVRNVVWRAPITGYGQSSPVVGGDRVFATSVSGPMKETCHLAAFDLDSGKRIWQRDFPAASTAENNGYVSKAAPTPVVDDGGIVALFEGGNLVAFDHDGDERWSIDLVETYGAVAARHGLGSSLVLADDLVFVWIERETDPYLLAIDPAAGTVRWKTDGLGATSWSTPQILSVGADRQLLLSGSGRLAGYEPATGRRLWVFDRLTGNTVASPRPVGSGEFLIGASVGRGEQPEGDAVRSNGKITVRPSGAGEFEVDFEWRSQRATCSFGSPIVHQGLAYFVNRSGVLFCLDATTGAEVYAERIAESVWATPLAIEDRIYFPGRSGVTTVVKAGREFHELARNDLWSDDPAAKAAEPNASTAPSTTPADSPGIQYAIAAVPGRLLLRTGDALYCLARLPPDK